MDANLAQKVKPGTKDLLKEIIRLPLDKQERLISNIAFNIRNKLSGELSGFGAIRHNAHVPQERLQQLCEAATAATGGSITGKRYPRNVNARMFVYAQLYREGYAIKEIGQAVGRTRETVVWYINQYDEMFIYRNANMSRIEQWLKFQEFIEKQK